MTPACKSVLLALYVFPSNWYPLFQLILCIFHLCLFGCRGMILEWTHTHTDTKLKNASFIKTKSWLKGNQAMGHTSQYWMWLRVQQLEMWQKIAGKKKKKKSSYKNNFEEILSESKFLKLRFNSSMIELVWYSSNRDKI